MKKQIFVALTAVMLSASALVAAPKFHGVFSTNDVNIPGCKTVMTGNMVVHNFQPGPIIHPPKLKWLIKDGFNAIVAARLFQAGNRTKVYGTPVKVECGM